MAKFNGMSTTYVLADGREVTEIADAAGNLIDAPEGLVSAGDVIDETSEYEGWELHDLAARLGSRPVAVYACYELEIEED